MKKKILEREKLVHDSYSLSFRFYSEKEIRKINIQVIQTP